MPAPVRRVDPATQTVESESTVATPRLNTMWQLVHCCDVTKVVFSFLNPLEISALDRACRARFVNLPDWAEGPAREYFPQRRLRDRSVVPFLRLRDLLPRTSIQPFTVCKLTDGKRTLTTKEAQFMIRRAPKNNIFLGPIHLNFTEDLGSDKSLQSLLRIDDGSPRFPGLFSVEFSDKVCPASLLEAVRGVRELKLTLEVLDMSFSAINDADLQQIVALCPNLKRLDLTGCSRLKNLSPISDLRKLERLAEWPISSGSTVRFPATLKRLIVGISVTDEELEQIVESLPRLEELDLASCKYISKIGCLEGLSDLKTLSISNNRQLTEFGCLQNLRLRNLNVSGVPHIASCLESLTPYWKDMETLDLSRCNLQDIHATYLSNMPRLRSLNLGCNNMTNAMPIEGMAGLDRLSALTLTCPIAAEKLKKQFPGLKMCAYEQTSKEMVLIPLGLRASDERGVQTVMPSGESLPFESDNAVQVGGGTTQEMAVRTDSPSPGVLSRVTSVFYRLIKTSEWWD